MYTVAFALAAHAPIIRASFRSYAEAYWRALALTDKGHAVQLECPNGTVVEF